MKNLAMLLCVCLLLLACSQKQEENTKTKFQLATAILTDTMYSTPYVAEINAIKNIEIRSLIKGIIEQVHVDEGQFVSKGQLLFSINSKQFQQELIKASAMLKSAKADYKSALIEKGNSESLFDKKIISKSELDLVLARLEALEANVEEAESDFEQAKLNLSFSEIKAPFDGYINRIPNKAGSLIEEGTLLTHLLDTKEVYAYFNVAENDYLQLIQSNEKIDQKEINLELSNGRLYPYKGVIETTESMIDRQTGNIAFRAKFPNPEGVLKHGLTGKVILTHAMENAILVPQKSTFEIQGNLYVYCVDKSGLVKMQKIESTKRLDPYYAIRSGLSNSDFFVLDGVQKVKEGDRVDFQHPQYTEVKK